MSHQSGLTEFMALLSKNNHDEVALRQYFQRVAENTEFKAWYFGHFHDDTEVEDVFFCLYDELIIIK